MSENITPSLKEFKQLAKKGSLIPIYMDVMADHLTPVAVYSARAKKSRYCTLLESVESGVSLGRYSILSFDPELILEENDGNVTFRNSKGAIIKTKSAFGLDELQEIISKYKAVEVKGLPPFCGGAVGYSSYETVHNLERLPKTNSDNLKWPQSTYFITKNFFVFDNTQQILKLVSCAEITNKSDVTAAYNRAKRKLHINFNWLKKTKFTPSQVTKVEKKNSVGVYNSNMSRSAYTTAVRRAKEYIGRGDIIQVVLSRTNERKTKASPLDIYRALRVVNPSPYMYLMKMGQRAIIGSSPESLVRLENGVALTRPIAGTRPRGATEILDLKFEKDLLKDPKEKAEHIMLVDLGRNDLGRVCRYGSVKVSKFFKVERYSHVMHIVSEVTGVLNKNKNAFDLIKAVFPAGTLSGAPKIRAMEIIDELEVSQRGPYGGALGYFSFSGHCDLAIIIRTVLWDKGAVLIQSGAGIVADSNPEKEYQETENKAAGIKKTIEMAEKNHFHLRHL